MLRVLLTVLLPLAAPFAIYFAWIWLARRRTAVIDFTAEWREAPLTWLAAAGLACGLAGLFYLYFSTGYPAGTRLAPPRVVDGVVVPSHPVE